MLMQLNFICKQIKISVEQGVYKGQFVMSLF